MAEFTPVIDVTEEYFTLDRYDFNDYIRSLGTEALIGVSFSLFDDDSEQFDQVQLLRKTKAFVEKSPNRHAVVVATDSQVAIEPNVFCSGIVRISSENSL